MKAQLAKRLVADLMQWDDQRATAEFAWFELMVDYKFDRYQGYGPGLRFYVHLLRWIAQYAPAERELAYSLLRERLIYVSQDEMHHLVALTGPSITRCMRTAIAERLGIPVYRVDYDPVARAALQVLQARTLYVGMSDGARIDVFRRFNEGIISNEQVVPMIEISEKKQAKLRKALGKRLVDIGSTESHQFEWVCLIDDFTASGTTAIRYESGEWDGKVPRFVEELGSATDLPLVAPGAHILVHHYLASNFASSALAQLVQQYGAACPQFRFLATFSYVLPGSVVVNQSSEPELTRLLETRYDPSVETDGISGRVALGYKQGGLPLILDHNTPNNSVGTLWARSNSNKPNYQPRNDMWPLFPRRQRHSDVR